MRDIYYFCPEIAEPCGGVFTIYQHVFWLNNAGINAYIVHENKDFQFAFFGKPVPILGYDQVRIHQDDAVVFPEGFDLEELARISACTSIFAQSLAGLFENNPPEKWSAFPPDRVICCSRAIQDLLYARTGIPARIIPNSVDRTIFKPAGKNKIVSYMPGKHPEQYARVIGLAQARGGYVRFFRFMRIEGKTVSECAEILSRSSVFLNLGTVEGFGLPPLEAMACGCLVTGFSNYGGDEYAGQDNGLWSNQGDLHHAALRLEEACRLIVRQESHGIVARGMDTVKGYSPEMSQAALLDFWR